MIKNHIPMAHYESRITNYQYASEFNKLVNALVLEIPFEKELTMEINT